MAGGLGAVLNTLIGVMNLMNVPGYHPQVVKGAIILAVMLRKSEGALQQPFVTDCRSGKPFHCLRSLSPPLPRS